MYRYTNGRPIEATDAIAEACSRLRCARQAAEIASDDIAAAELEIKVYMATCDTLTSNGNVLATWKRRAGSTRIDAKRLKAEAPDVFAKYAVTGDPTRQFLLKEPK
jgi:predicted phage-related endonuclease